MVVMAAGRNGRGIPVVVVGEVCAKVFEALNYLDVGFTLDVGRFELVHFGLV